MSDYVSNALQACFDPSSTATDVSPFSSTTEQPIMSGVLDEFDWDGPRYEGPANVDWPALHEDMMHTMVEQPAAEEPNDR